MAPHSSTFAWKIPWTEEPGVLQSVRIQASNCIGPGRSIFHSGCEGKLGSALELLQGKSDLS